MFVSPLDSTPESSPVETERNVSFVNKTLMRKWFAQLNKKNRIGYVSLAKNVVAFECWVKSLGLSHIRAKFKKSCLLSLTSSSLERAIKKNNMDSKAV